MSVALSSLLEGLQPSEIRAVMEHKYFLGIELGFDPPMEMVIASWESRFACDWRARKMRKDAEVQVREIEAYRAKLSTEKGTPVTFRDAARLWVDRCECDWRKSWESSGQAGA